MYWLLLRNKAVNSSAMTSNSSAVTSNSSAMTSNSSAVTSNSSAVSALALLVREHGGGGSGSPALRDAIQDLVSRVGPAGAFKSVSQLLGPGDAFALHKGLYEMCYEGTPEENPRKAWFPSERVIQQANLTKALADLGIDTYEEFYAFSVRDKEAYWKYAIDMLEIRFKKPFSSIFKYLGQDDGAPEFEYLPDAKLNIVDSCFTDLDENPERKAVIYQREGSENLEYWSLARLNEMVNRVASALTNPAFKSKCVPGDAVAICMPMTVESIAIYLGIVKAGLVVVSIADSFAAVEIALRMEIAKAKLIFTQDAIHRGSRNIPLYERVIEAQPQHVVVLGGFIPDKLDKEIALRDADTSWEELMSLSSSKFETVYCDPLNDTNLLFSSGTTSAPKAIPWNHSTPIKAAADGYFHQDIHRHDIVCWPTNIGWMMGPWLIYAGLINKACIALHHSSPTTKAFVDFVEASEVSILGLVPSIVKAFRSQNLIDSNRWQNIRLFSSTGEASNPDDYLWLMSRVKGYVPVIEYCGGTEIGGGYISGTVLQPQAPSMFSSLNLGLAIALLDESGDVIDDAKASGEVAIIPPSLGLSVTLHNGNHRKVYFEGMKHGFRKHGDEMMRIKGYFRALGRADDTMKLGGIKISSVELEKVCNMVDNVLETACIAYNPPSGGPSWLIVYAVIESACTAPPTSAQLKVKFQEIVKAHLNPLFHVHDVIVIPSLPRTASNKIMRRVLRDQYAHITSGRASL